MTSNPAPDHRTPHPSHLTALAIERKIAKRTKLSLSREHMRILIVAAVALVVGAVWVWRSYAPIAVKTTLVSNVFPSQALSLLNATGYVVAQRKASVASKATGRLEWLGVLEGSEVREGEVIARLENRDTEAMRDQAAANVLLAEANLSQGKAELADAESAFRRSEALAGKNLVAESVHDSALARLSKARAAVAGFEASVAVARANLRISEVALDQTMIRAPFNGVVLTRNANLGDTITPFSQAVDTKGAVVTIADMDTLEVEADVGEASFLSLRVGQPVEIQLDAIPGQRFEGVISRMVPTMDRAKASTLIKIRFVKRDPRTLPDMSAKVSFLDRALSDAERKPVPALPASAIVEKGGVNNVYVVKDGHAYLQRVDLGPKMGELVEVRGLAIGTRVVVKPPSGLSDGRAVTEETK